MEQHQRGGAGARGRPKHFARVDDARVERAHRQERRPQDPVLRVQQDDPELLDRPGAVLRHQELGDVPWRHDLQAVAADPYERPPAGFDRRDELRGPRLADVRHPPQVIRRRPRQAVEPPHGREHRVRQFQGTGPGRAVPQDDGEELVVPEAARTDAFEFFPRTIVRRNGLHRTSSCWYTSPRCDAFWPSDACSCARQAAPNLLRKKSIPRKRPSRWRAPPAPTSTRRTSTPRRRPRCRNRATPWPSAITAWRSTTPSTPVSGPRTPSSRPAGAGPGHSTPRMR